MEGRYPGAGLEVECRGRGQVTQFQTSFPHICILLCIMLLSVGKGTRHGPKDTAWIARELLVLHSNGSCQFSFETQYLFSMYPQIPVLIRNLVMGLCTQARWLIPGQQGWQELRGFP